MFDRVGKTDPVTRGIEITVNYLGIQFDVRHTDTHMHTPAKMVTCLTTWPPVKIIAGPLSPLCLLSQQWTWSWLLLIFSPCRQLFDWAFKFQWINDECRLKMIIFGPYSNFPCHCIAFHIPLFFLPISGKVLVPTHLFHLGGNHNCYIHSWLTYYPH